MAFLSSFRCRSEDLCCLSAFGFCRLPAEDCRFAADWVCRLPAEGCRLAAGCVCRLPADEDRELLLILVLSFVLELCCLVEESTDLEDVVLELESTVLEDVDAV